ncbi:hypothetical protein Sdia_32140 [Streptomyces diastaticus subsp. diastaticus]|uniref:Uncharacterized protein n=1 Tax=Streptomyces diastaticus subsp. diastaticus TaxID=68040 RepID=A0ABQ1CQR4_STRDI|nr:hypothetical protein Srut_36840 [Streptomyces rutgersensis]GFH72446.1 hypothetical protein Sdia_32140 [Streptomyces diastaticus subsp. diastaticus]GGU42827.1 hypothetical protein GCM10015534_51750 [Streptomyces diastaticus subsp. diastaticus]
MGTTRARQPAAGRLVGSGRARVADVPAVQLLAALASGSSRLCSGPATKPSSETDMWQVVSVIGFSPQAAGAGVVGSSDRATGVRSVRADRTRRVTAQPSEARLPRPRPRGATGEPPGAAPPSAGPAEGGGPR